MKKHIPFVTCFSVLAALFFAGCATTPPAETALHRPKSVYPKIYDIQVGTPTFVDVTKTAAPDLTLPAVSSGAVVGQQVNPTTTVSAGVSGSSGNIVTQKITVEPKKKLYCQVLTPIGVKATIYQRSTPDSPRIQINEVEGTRIVTWVKPDYAELEFDFSPLKAGDSSVIKFIVSDRVLVK